MAMETASPLTQEGVPLVFLSPMDPTMTPLRIALAIKVASAPPTASWVPDRCRFIPTGIVPEPGPEKMTVSLKMPRPVKPMPDEVPPALAAAPSVPVDASPTEDPAPKELLQARCDETAAPVEVDKPPGRVQPPANGDVDVSAERKGVAPADEAKNRLNTAIGMLKRMRTSSVLDDFQLYPSQMSRNASEADRQLRHTNL